MQAQRTLLSLVLSLLLLSATVAMPGCSGSYTQLLGQLRSQANMEENTSLPLLESYIHLQSLNTDALRTSCLTHPSMFPSEDALRALSKLGFLRTVLATLSHILPRLTAVQKQLLQDQDLKGLTSAMRNIQGMRNNIHCMAWWLGSSLKMPESTQASPEASRTLTPGTTLAPTPALGVFWSKMKSCRLLWDYHRFVGSVGRVFGDWEDTPNRSRRHSPRRVLLKGDHKSRPSRRGRRLVRRGQRPR